MAIIAEAFSVFVRRQTVYTKLRTGRDYYKTIQNPSIGADPDLYRAGFLTMKDVEEHLEALRGLGFQVERDGRFEDACVVDQHAGLLKPCSWILRDHLEMGDGPPIPYCRMVDDEDGPPETLEDMTVPNLWTLEGHRSIRPNPAGDYEPALSRTYNTPKEAFGRRLPIAGTPTKKMREVIRKGREAWRAAGIRMLDDGPHGAPPSQPGGGRPRR